MAISGKIRRVSIGDVEPGTRISGFEKEGEGMIHVINILVRSRRDIERFRGKGYSYAHVTDLRADPGLKTEVLGAAGAPVSGARHEDTVEMDGPAERVRHDGDHRERAGSCGEIKEARDIRSEAEGLVRAVMTGVRKRRAPDLERVAAAAGRMVESILRRPDALTGLTRIKDPDDYTTGHSVNVCILSLAVGLNMGLDKKSLHDLGMGALLHDLGKAFVPPGILLKRGKLSAAELDTVKRHTLSGAKALNGSRMGAGAMSVVLHHHENYNGTGYPGRTRGEDIHLFARIARVADAYDAMTSDRAYEEAMTPHDALREMYHLGKKEFDPVLVERLIRCVGVYPAGTLVELNTGEVGAVMVPNDRDPMSPVVLMLYGRDGAPYPRPFDVDLEDDITRQVTGSLSYEGFNVSQEDILKKIGII